MSTHNFSDTKVLYVDPDEQSRHMVSSNLLHTFKNVFFCASGEEGLEIYKNNKIDLIISEYSLPKMDGMQFLSSIRGLSRTVPFIFTTAYDDMDFIISSINLDVNRLVKKPIHMRKLNETLNSLIENVVRENARRERMEAELHNLKVYEDYHFSQMETAFAKELNAISNDFNLKVMECGDKQWFADIFYKGMDIMSGDSYSMHKCDDTRAFFFMIDAMGKGVGASVTSMQSTTFINYITGKKEDFPEVIEEYLDYIKQTILPDEIIAALFIGFDLENEFIIYSSFGMPKGYIIRNGKLEYLKANNMPINIYINDYTIDQISLTGVEKMLFCTDGLSEATNGVNNFSEELDEHIIHATNLSSLKNIFNQKGYSYTDDATILFIKYPTGDVLKHESHCVNSTLNGVSELENKFESFINSIENFQTKDKAMFSISFSEAVVNAFEHGNLGLDCMQKHRAIEQDIYDSLIVELQNKYQEKVIKAEFKYKKDTQHYIMVTIHDEGEGFPRIGSVLKKDPMLLCGRGIEIMKQYTDGLYYNEKGNLVTLIKNL